MAQKNDDGTVVAAPSMAIADPMNLMDESIDFDKLISADTKTIGDYVTQTSYSAQGSTKINNPLANANVQEMVNNLINKYTNNTRSAAQVLTTYGEDYDFYETQEEKNQLINNYKAELKQEDPSLTDKQIDAASKDYERYLISVNLTDNNKYEPVLSQEQIEEAKKIIKFQVEGRIDFSETKLKPVAPKKPLKGKEISATAKSANSIVSNLNNILSDTPSSKGASSLTKLIGDIGNREVRFEGGGYKLYEFDPNSFPLNPKTGYEDKSKGKGVWKLKQNLGKTVNDYRVVFGFNASQNRVFWEEAVNNL
jgi:hypothetical protein